MTNKWTQQNRCQSTLNTLLQLQMNSGWTVRDDNFFLQVGHFRPPAFSLRTPFRHASQKTWPHVVDITCRPLAFTSMNESRQMGHTALGDCSGRLPSAWALFVGCFVRGLVSSLNGTGGSSSSEMLPSLTRYGERQLSSFLVTDLVVGVSGTETETGLLLSKFVKSTKL